jgi:hypothetical protein
MLPEALAIAQSIAAPHWKAVALARLVSRFPVRERDNIYHAVLTATQAIAREEKRASMLVGLAPHLPANLLPEALAIAQSITGPQWRTTTLMHLAPDMLREQQGNVYRTAVADLRAIADEEKRAETLLSLTPYLPADLLPEALAVVDTISDESRRIEILRSLASHLPPDEQGNVYRAVLVATQAIVNEGKRAETLSTLVPHLPPELRPDALTITRTMDIEHLQADILIQLALYLSHDLLPIALAAARALADEKKRVEALQVLAPHLAAHRVTHMHCHTTVRTLAARGRPTYLRDLAALTPWLAALASPEELTEIAIAIRDVCRCWP